MLKLISNQRTANLNKLSLHTHPIGKIKKWIITSIGEDVCVSEKDQLERRVKAERIQRFHSERKSFPSLKQRRNHSCSITASQPNVWNKLPQMGVSVSSLLYSPQHTAFWLTPSNRNSLWSLSPVASKSSNVRTISRPCLA